jgi:hypothetical protein
LPHFGNAHGAVDQHVHAGGDVSRHEQRCTGGMVPNFPETAKPIDFMRHKALETSARGGYRSSTSRASLLGVEQMQV